MSQPERETLEMDVVFVGAGPASLAGAIHLANLIERHNSTAKEPITIEIAVLEKGAEVGAHGFSGAVVDPVALRELLPDTWQQAPFEAPVGRDRVWWLSESGGLDVAAPPPLSNEGYYVASLAKLVKWLAPIAEAKGVNVLPEFPASELLYDGDAVVGVRTGDKGVDKEGRPKANFEPGMDVVTRCVVLGEGVRGTLTKQLDKKLDLWRGKNPQVYAIGMKELWELPPGRIAPGEVIHTMNWPNGKNLFGGGFLYGMQNDTLILGLVVGLDYEDPWTDPHDLFQRYKTHPKLKALLAGGKMVNYGAKAIPEGGWFSMPRLSGPGFLIVGDSGGFVNAQKLKGISVGMKSGMLAAETIFESLVSGDFSGPALASFERKVEASWIKTQMWQSRNFHQAFEKGLFGGLVQGALGIVSGGRGWGIKNRLPGHAGHENLKRLDQPEGARFERREKLAYDGVLTFDRLADVYNSGTAHEEDQPVHLLVHDPETCVTRCAREFGNPCERFCPAAVYEIVDDPSSPHGRRLQINAANCVHCTTCDILDPYQIIDWVPPEGGGGPNYGKM
ncbi:MAG: electron transfer flavoprotein-ubiquinone oxidoreductase [Thermoanaerobaculia bacterium]|nr:electron transfer flavoprotein-ubiquinone oxidoreductase [Thermoanaerobaculia bacterium]